MMCKLRSANWVWDCVDASHILPLMLLLLLLLMFTSDHRGISNMQLAKEVPDMATMYKNKSIAEVGWGMC
jgi:hypothetical protein